MSEHEQQQPAWRLEQHVGTILQLMVVGLLGWSLTAIVNLKSEVGVVMARLEALQNTVAQGTSDRYRGSDAARDNAALWNEINRMSSRIDKLESRR